MHLAKANAYFGIINRHYPDLANSTMVTDGGGENHAVSISELLRQTESPAITKIIAQKDICFSNSPVEAINRIMKRYLRHNAPQSFGHLKSVLTETINDYNEIRPHGSLHGLTPKEAYTTRTSFSISKSRRNWPEFRELRKTDKPIVADAAKVEWKP